MMKDYSKMSDFEINNAVAVAIGFDSDRYKEFYICYGAFNPVGKNDDCMQFAWKHGIGIELLRTSQKWLASLTNNVCAVTATSFNPRRAICECFLKMKDYNV